jgi:hypothetical protein
VANYRGRNTQQRHKYDKQKTIKNEKNRNQLRLFAFKRKLLEIFIDLQTALAAEGQ